MSKEQQCPEFPYFGAGYPDATCIDGRLWDLDKCNDDGTLYSHGDNPPCPFCNMETFIENNYESFYPDEFDDDGLSPTEIEVHEAAAKERCREHVIKFHKEYGYQAPAHKEGGTNE